jgi:sterol desaturase/sphingolipid hydroxylase (fatty acid hydroxylase superfamily)
MKYIPPGTGGLCASLGVPLLVWYLVNRRTPTFGSFLFERPDQPGSFEKRLESYVRAVEYFLGMATGSIVLLVGSASLRANGKLPWVFGSPLVIIGFCVVYGVMFMSLLIYDYEMYLHHHIYSRSHYIRNQTFGFSTLACFCLGYLWLVCSVAVVMTK